MNKKIIKILAAIALFVVSIAVIYFYYHHNPAENNNPFLGCAFKNYLGIDCPACGAQRSFHYLLNGNLAQSFKENALFFIVLPFLLYYIFMALRSYFFEIAAPKNFFTSRKWGNILIFSIICFFILRNLPFLEFLKSSEVY